MAEYAKSWASGVGVAGLATGAYALLNNGGLNGLLGGNNNYVSKESFDLSMQLSQSQRDNALLSAELNTEKKMVEVFNSLNDKINNVVNEQAAINSAQAVSNTAVTSNLAVINNNVSQLMALTQLKIPNTSVCPGWGTATVSVATGTTTA